jgi:hypothetical protein
LHSRRAHVSILRLGRSPISPKKASEDHSIDLACHDQIVLVQSFDFIGAQENRYITPTETYIRVMALGFGELADFPASTSTM